MVKLEAAEPKVQVGHCFSHNLHSHSQIQSANLIGIAHHHCTVQYHFDRKFTNSENLLTEMADKFSFEF